MFSRETSNDINPFVLLCQKSDLDHIPPHGTVGLEREVKAYELEFIESSEGGYRIIDGKKYSLKKGDLFFRKPGMISQCISPSHVYIVVFCMVHNGSDFFLDPISLPEERSNYLDAVYHNNSSEINTIKIPFDFPTVMNVSQFNEFKELFDHIYLETIRQREQSHFFSKTYLQQIFSLMYTELAVSNLQQHSSRSVRLNYKKIFEVKNFIDNNIKSKFRLVDLATIAGLSPNFFCKIFKEIVGLTPVEYINKSKINSIKNALISTDKEIKEICDEYGFSDHSYFFNMFKKLQGMTPSNFRKINQFNSYSIRLDK